LTEGRLLKPLPERDWRLYSKAQVEEVRLFDLLLTDLTSTVPEPARTGAGRPPVPLSDQAWVAVKKAHTGYSSRRNQGHVLDAQQDGLLEAAPRYNATSDFLNAEGTAELLRGLVRASALPLAGIEEDFAVDSTGFACGTYGSYRDFRYGEVRRREWVKLHAAVGVRFNIVTDALVTPNKGKGTGDTTNMETLALGTAESFTIRDWTADGAYSSKKNHHLVKQLGGQALIPFAEEDKTPSTAKGAGSYANAPGLPGSSKTWRKAYAYFLLHQEEFYSRYHKRSNVEATFGAMKQTLGERLKSKKPLAQQNEVLCKVVAWNIRCVVRARRPG
jgi:Transposase DDE domain